MAGLKRLGGVTFHHAGAFWFGVVAVTAGVIAHIPMYLMGENIGYRLVLSNFCRQQRVQQSDKLF